MQGGKGVALGFLGATCFLNVGFQLRECLFELGLLHSGRIACGDVNLKDPETIFFVNLGFGNSRLLASLIASAFEALHYCIPCVTFLIGIQEFFF